jgi:hypothetical protein
VLARILERRFRVGPSNRDFLCHVDSAALRALDFERELLEQIGMRLRIDLATEQSACAYHGDLRNFLPQLFARTRRFELDALSSFGNQALAFRQGTAPSFFDQLVRAAIRLLDDLGCLCARFLDDFRCAGLGLGQALLAFLGRRKAFRDLATPIIDRRDQRRPNELHRYPSKNEEND